MLTPSSIAAARADLNRHFYRNLALSARRGLRHLHAVWQRLVEAERQRRELGYLLGADDRVLSDIGLTRADVHFAFGAGRKSERWHAARERDEARVAANGIERLPQVNAPALAPALPRHVMTHDNFR